MNRTKPTAIPKSEQVASELVALAQQTFAQETTATTDAGLVAFERAVARRTLRRHSVSLTWLIAGSAVAAALIVSLVTWRDRPRVVTFTVVNGTVSNGGYVRANQIGGTALNFSDGSSLALDPDTGARVGDFSPHGGRVLLETGRARVHVNPRPRANWTVDAGPYSVHVIGTEFDIRWAANDQVLDLHLLKGAIVVRGPLARDGISMEAGAHLFANVRKGEIWLEGQSSGGGAQSASAAELGAAAVSGSPGSAASATPHEAPAAADVSSGAGIAVAVAGAGAGTGARATRSGPAIPLARMRTGAGAVAGLRASGADTGSPWAARVAHGDFHGVLADAEQRGLDGVFARAPANDLSALADAARFARRADVARAALLAERGRFPGSLQGREAAFFLGGLSEDEAAGDGAFKSALEWYDLYLRENPRGAFLRQVLGRKMVLVQRLRGTTAARPIATEYLDRFSDGPYAGTARRLLENR